jgi:hypothetical protein
MATDDSAAEPQRALSGCVFWMVAAALLTFAVVIVIWWVVSRIEPAAAPDGQGPIEAAEPPVPD